VILALLGILSWQGLVAAADGDDYYNDDGVAVEGSDDAVNNNYQFDDGYNQQLQDDYFVWDESKDWSEVSVMPVSCIN
jgi:hypothetical protein